MKIRTSAIVAMSENRVIGRDNDLPWHLPEDLKRFKSLTTGKPVIMGRKTFDSIVSRLGKPLPNRTNIVISRSSNEIPGALVSNSIEAALGKARAIAAKDGQEEIMIIGGAEIFRETLPVTDRIYLTVIHDTIEGDAFFPELGPQWKEIAWDNRGDFSFVTLDRA
jgi:dihydrofolate reductase